MAFEAMNIEVVARKFRHWSQPSAMGWKAVPVNSDTLTLGRCETSNRTLRGPVWLDWIG